MAHATDLPCDGDGNCMHCKNTPSEEEKLICSTCATPWHVTCLSNPPSSLSSLPQWQCPDCSPPSDAAVLLPPWAGSSYPSSDLISAVRAIEADDSLTEREKARRRQELMSRPTAAMGGGSDGLDESEASPKPRNTRKNDVLDLLDGSLNCCFCMQLLERPVTTPCGHNFCLKCFQKWTGQGKRSCATCRCLISPKMMSQPRINSALVAAIRTAKTAKSVVSGTERPVYHFVHNQNRPDKAFTTERAKRAGKANACSGKIFVTVPPDHFGPILAENDPARNQGVLVGESWEDRMECRQWGAHLPHVAGIAGQSEYGAQSVALSGGYQDDEDHGEWFLYTGSGGRDLSGNKRTNKEQSFDQQFEKLNEALRVSCKKGYPVRVVRSHKEKRSSYAPETGVRYDGIYRIEKCWRRVGVQGFKVCRYLFVRCDNEPAPWTSDEHGDRPRPLPVIKELKNATDITERKGSPAWDYDEEHGWRWAKPPPPSRKPVATGNPDVKKRTRKVIRHAQNLSVREKLLKEFSCLLCHKVMNLPLTTPCAHNFCKPCLEGAFEGQTFVRERTKDGGRTLRAQKNVMKCPCCPHDISDFLQNPQVNRDLMDVIESLKKPTEEDTESSEDGINGVEKSDPIDEDTEAGSKIPEEAHDVDNDIDATESKQSRMSKQKKTTEVDVKKRSNDGRNGTNNKEKSDHADGDTEVRPVPEPAQEEDSQTAKRASKQLLKKKIKNEKAKSDKKLNDSCFEDSPKMPEPGNDCQVLEAKGKQLVSCTRKKTENGKKVMGSRDSNDSDSDFENPKMAHGDQQQSYKQNKTETVKRSKNKRRSNDMDSKNAEMENENSKGDQSFTPESKQPMTYKRKKTETSKKTTNGKNSSTGNSESKQPVTYTRKTAGTSKKATNGKKSNGTNSANPKLADRNGEGLQTRSLGNKQTVTYKRKKTGNEKGNGSKKPNEAESENHGVAVGAHKDCKTPAAESKRPVTYQRKKTEVGKRTTRSSKLNESGSENHEIQEAGSKECRTPDIKLPVTYMRKRPLTRSCSAKMAEKEAKKSRKASRLRGAGGESPSSPLLVQSDDDFE